MTVREICSILEFGEGIKPEILLTYSGYAVTFNRKDALEMAAYGDFLVESCHVSNLCVKLIVKQQFVRKGGAA